MINSNTKKKIQLLPNHLIDQIKAGEVVESPSAIIKEIIENSIDANSTKISITISENGMDYIKLEDNGDGIDYNDIPLAFQRHTTSKINRYEDLYNLYSFGFRGEALASIASVARVTCISTTASQSGGKYEIHGGQEISLTPYSSPNAGTILIIKDLFYNTPVRLNFLKSQNSERIALRRIINAFILTNPKIEFVVHFIDADSINHEKEIFGQCDETEQYKKRIEEVLLGNKKNSNPLIDINNSHNEIEISGYISQNILSSNAKRSQFFFVNKRLCNDIAINKIITRAAASIWGQEKSGAFCIMLSLPPEMIDVNIHPNKTLIKFIDQTTIHSLIHSSINSILKKTIAKEEIKNSTISNSTTNSSTTNHDTLSNSYSGLDIFKTIQPPYSINNSTNDLKVNSEVNSTKDSEANSSNMTDHSLVIKISESFSIYKDTNTKKFFLINNRLIAIKKLINHLKLFTTDQKQGIETTPLLIAIPINSNICNHNDNLKFFNDIGVEIDTIDSNYFLVRSVPQLLLDLEISLKDFFSTLVSEINLQNVTLKSFDDLEFLLKNSHKLFFNNSNNNFSSSIENSKIDYLDPSTYIELNDQNLTLFFQNHPL